MDKQVALITGSARGIGFACAKSLAKRGASVVLTDILDCGEAKQELETEFPGIRVLALKVDVRDRSQVEQAVSQTIEEFGRIDIVVNNAGTVSRLNLKDMTDEDWSRDIETNLRGTFLFTQAAIYPHMVNQGSGRIINISSISGMMGGAISYGEDGERQGRSGPAYAASKGGIIAFTKWVAKEVASSASRSIASRRDRLRPPSRKASIIRWSCNRSSGRGSRKISVRQSPIWPRQARVM